MPIRCVDDQGISLEASALTQEEWRILKTKARNHRHLIMPCCKAHAIPKTSKLGTQFFAHKARANCLWKRETEVHLRLKMLAIQAARRARWKAETEVSGQAPDGGLWMADVLAEKGEEKIVIEVQWSGQTNEETFRRQSKYHSSGIMAIWLLRQPDFSISEDLPAVCIGGSIKDGLKVMIPKHDGMTVSSRDKQKNWSQIFDIGDFFDAVFNGRFKFGIPNNTKGILDILSTYIICWKCRKDVQVITTLRGNLGPYKVLKSGETGPQYLAKKYPDIKERIIEAIKDRRDIGRAEILHAFEEVYVIRCQCPKCGIELQRFQNLNQYTWKILGKIEIDVVKYWEEFINENPFRWAVWPAQVAV